MSRLILIALLLLTGRDMMAQAGPDQHALMIRKIHEYSLKEGKCYDWLYTLCKQAGPRLAGHNAYNKAVEITREQLNSISGVRTFIQQTTTQKWMRGEKEEVYFTDTKGQKTQLTAFALGNSVGTAAE